MQANPPPAPIGSGFGGDDFRADGVRAHQPVGPVLLGRADRDDDAGLGLEVVVDELSRLELKLHETKLL